MFIIIQKRSQKRVPTHLQTSRLKKNPFADPFRFSMPGMPSSCTYYTEGEEIKRSPEWVLDVKIRHNMRVSGKIKSVTEHIGTCNYWDFIDDYISGGEKQCFRAEDRLSYESLYDAMDNIEKKLGLYPEIVTDNDYTRHNKESERLRGQIIEKLAVYRKEAEDHFLTKYYENEAQWIDENIRVNEEVRKLNDAEEKKKQTYREQQQRQQGSKQSGSHNNSNSMPYMTADQKRMFNDIIKYGYRKLASEYHPDKSSGSEEKMIDLNDLKDLLDKTL